MRVKISFELEFDDNDGECGCSPEAQHEYFIDVLNNQLGVYYDVYDDGALEKIAYTWEEL